jgi:hypothetical protein
VCTVSRNPKRCWAINYGWPPSSGATIKVWGLHENAGDDQQGSAT